MEDIDKNADGFIDLEEYIGKSPVSRVLKYRNALEVVIINRNGLPHGSTLTDGSA